MKMVWILTIALFQTPGNAQKDPPIGMLVQADGQVQIRRRGAQTSARIADFIYAGDRLSVGLGSARLLFCPSSETIAVGDDSAIDVTSKTVQVVRGVPVRQKEDGCPLLRLELGSETLERAGGRRARGLAPIALYLGGPVSVSRPVFAWASIPGAESYRIILRDDNGTVVWETVTAELSLTYPVTRSPLRMDSYEWEVRAEAGAKTLAGRSATFVVNSPASSLNRLSRDPLLKHATELENAGYYTEAAAVFREIRKAHPDDDRFTRHLVWLYSNAGLIDAAEEELKRLEARRAK